jgi:choline kinase
MKNATTHTGIIYAAGINSRLISQIDQPFKGMCTAPSGESLITLQAKHLISLDVEVLVVVVGMEHKILVDHLKTTLSGLDFKVAFNGDYCTKGNMLSLWSAREWCHGEITFTTSDLYFSEQLPSNFARDNFNQILTDTHQVKLFRDPDPVKLSIRDDFITRVNKSLPPQKVKGVAPGFYHFNASGTQRLLEDIHQEISAGRDDQSLYWSIDRIAPSQKVKPVYVNSTKWIDVDTPNDLVRLLNI